MNVCYKVFSRREDGLLVSALARGEGGLEYEENKPTRAHPKFAELGYHPTAFDLYRDARVFLEMVGMGNGELWQCVGEDVAKLPEYRLNVADPIAAYMLMDVSACMDLDWPTGTIMYRQITPIAREI